MLETFYITFLDTTDPSVPYESLLSNNVAFSISAHILLYFVVYMALVQLFDLPDKSLVFLVGITSVLCAGYIGRLARTKSIYRVLMQNGQPAAAAREKAKSIIREAYFTWYYLA
jgi:hypothetical protein